MRLLRLRKATEEELKDTAFLSVDGYTFQSITEEFASPLVPIQWQREVLRQRVAELTAEQPQLQSDDPTAPGYVPRLFVPRELSIVDRRDGYEDAE